MNTDLTSTNPTNTNPTNTNPTNADSVGRPIPMNRARRAAAGIALVAALGPAACGIPATAGPATTSRATAGASSTTSSGTTSSGSASITAAGVTAAVFDDNAPSHADADDIEVETDSVDVSLVNGGSSAAGEGVAIDGDTISITSAGTYVLTGTLTDGSIVVSSAGEGHVRLVLAGASVTNTGGAALSVTEADEVVIVLADGTTNHLEDGSGYDTSAEDAPNAALFSMTDLTIGGAGSLTVTGNTDDGIASKDGLVILGGTVTVTAVDDGIRGKDYLIVEAGTLEVSAGGDALTSDNETDDTVGYLAVLDGTVTISAGDDGMHAEGDLAIAGGVVTVTESVEGIEGANVVISGGEITVAASDDGVNAVTESSTGGGMGPGGGGMADDGSLLEISGGTLVVDADGDGLDSNGRLVISGGTTVVNGPTDDGNGAIDANGGVEVSAGTLLAAGSAGMAEAPASGSAQGWVSIMFASAVPAGQTIQVVSGDTVIASFTTTKETSSVVLATDGIEPGTAYDVYAGGEPAAETVGTFSVGGDLGDATVLGSVTAGQHASAGPGPR